MKRCFYGGKSFQNRRDTNMDSLLIKEREISEKKVWFAAVCDGVGSMKDGAYAASAAVHGLSRWFDHVEDTTRLGLQLRDNVLSLNREIVAVAQDKGLQTAATLSALLLERDRYYIVHVGDSRIYSLHQGALSQLTRDHTSPTGRLAACIGRWKEISVDYDEGKPEDRLFLLCSDGLYRRMDMGHLKSKLTDLCRKNLENTIDELIRYVVSRGETDNISLALIKNEG